MIFTSISYLLFLPLIVLAYYLWPTRRTSPPRTSPPTPLLGGEGSASTRNEGGNSFQWIWLALASVAYYLSFIPVFFALIKVLVIGNIFTDKQAHKEIDMSIVMSAHLTLNHLTLNHFFKFRRLVLPRRSHQPDDHSAGVVLPGLHRDQLSYRDQTEEHRT